MSFQIGQIIYLNSGSPKLTVTQDGGINTQASWINEKGDRQMMTAPNECFTPFDPNPTLDNDED